MNCCSPAMRLIAKVSMFLSSLAAIHLGLMSIDYDALSVLRLHEYARPLGYIFGIAGVISFVMLCMWCMTKYHGSCNCTYGSSSGCSCK